MNDSENINSQSSSCNHSSDLLGFKDDEKEVYQEMADLRTSLNNKILIYGLILMTVGFAVVIVIAFC